MPMNISRLSVGNEETELRLRAILDELGVPEGEDWTASITAHSATAAWEVVLDGAPRAKADHVDWEILSHDVHSRFRRMFLGKDEQTPDFFKRSVRKLLWECVQFKDNPIRNHSAKLGEAFEEVVWNLLRHEDMKPVQVRFGVWREGPDGMKFVCKVEYSSDRRVPWSWWSGLVRTPQDLANELTRALAVRRKRQVVAPSIGGLRRARRA
ncbi:MAG TPA: hypothetical protein VGQ33_07130, partial [Vicinamibacteria bacterium]|nr:hypothetical protein [Vicinamibacteria bacterium]